MTNNKTIKLALVVLLVAIVTMSIISGTLAKYVESVTGTDTARVAKFAYTATAGGTTLTDGATINLFNTANDTEVYGESANINNEKLVAPGTHGSFTVEVSNTSEVDIGVSYKITETNDESIPIVYYLDNGTTKTYYSSSGAGTSATLGSDVATALGGGLTETSTVTISGDLSAMAEAIGTTLKATNGTTAKTGTSTIGWFWAFGETARDTADTTLGKAGTATVAVNLEVTFEQVD